MSIPGAKITGAVLAGGRGERMAGADKGLLTLAGKLLVAHALERLAPQVASVVISANRNVERYAALGHPVVTDTIAGFAGPLAGVHAVLGYATTRYVVTVPCDVPRFPGDLVARLANALSTGRTAVAAVARAGSRMQPVFALYDRGPAHASLTAYLQSGARRADAWQASLMPIVVDFEDVAVFHNLNTPAELAAAAP